MDLSLHGHSICTVLVSTILLSIGGTHLYTFAAFGHFCPQLSELSIIS